MTVKSATSHVVPYGGLRLDKAKEAEAQAIWERVTHCPHCLQRVH